MATYGKKKRSLIPSFSSFNFSQADAATKPKKEKSKLRASRFKTMPNLAESNRPETQRDAEDSIEEMASMLLDDTTMNQLNTNTEPGRRLSQMAAAEAYNAGHMELGDSKELPQLPKLVFNGDDAWAMKTAPVVTAAGSSNQMTFNGNTEPSIGQISTHTGNHSRKGSAPTIPRKSSKRKSARPKSNLHHAKGNTSRRDGTAGISREALKASISPPKPLNLSPPKKMDTSVDINDKVQNMLAATRALKGDDSIISHGPVAPNKKRRLVDTKVLSKMKTALNDRLHSRGTKKRDSIMGGRLLDNSINDGGFQDDMDVAATALTTLEIRMNEGETCSRSFRIPMLKIFVGNNLQNLKISKMMGHGNVPRKPLADDGKSLRSRKSEEDPFSERPFSRSTTRKPVGSQSRLRDDMSLDESSEDSPALPSRAVTPERFNRGLPRRPATVSDFDALLSSSPLAQSTPRLRLEPTFEENGKKVLKNVLAESRSVFDLDPDNSMLTSEMEIDGVDVPSRRVSVYSADVSRRKSPQTRQYRASLGNHGSKRMKKHPSPSKAELERLEYALRNFSAPSQEAEDFVTSGVLTPKDGNLSLQDSKRRSRVHSGGLKVPTLEILSSDSVPILSYIETPEPKETLMEKLSAAQGRRSSIHNSLTSSKVDMDIDELQWDTTAYNVGMRGIV